MCVICSRLMLLHHDQRMRLMTSCKYAMHIWHIRIILPARTNINFSYFLILVSRFTGVVLSKRRSLSCTHACAMYWLKDGKWKNRMRERKEHWKSERVKEAENERKINMDENFERMRVYYLEHMIILFWRSVLFFSYWKVSWQNRCLENNLSSILLSC